MDDLHILIDKIQPHCILITETWLCDEIDGTFLSIPEYTIFRRDRGDGNDRHGGVMIAVKTHLNPIPVDVADGLEVLFVDLRVDGQHLRLGVAYRPPGYDASQNEQFTSCIDQCISRCNNFCIFGDFNFPNIDWKTYSSSSMQDTMFLNMINERSISQVISEPTRGSKILDLVLCSHEHLVSCVNVCENFSTSDHSYITCNINMKVEDKKIRKVIPSFRSADWDLMREYLATVDWDDLFGLCVGDCCAMYEHFVRMIREVLLFVPLVTVSPTKNAPWFNGCLQKLINKKKRKWNKYKKNRSLRNLRDYKNHCKLVEKKVAEY